MSQFDIKLDYLSSHMVSQELYHHQFLIYFISSAQCQDFIFHSALTLVIPHMFQSKGMRRHGSYNPSGQHRLQNAWRQDSNHLMDSCYEISLTGGDVELKLPLQI